MPEKDNRFSRVILLLFDEKFKTGSSTLEIQREELIDACTRLQIAVPRNLGDIVYSFRYRSPLPDSIMKRAPKGKSWIIMPGGSGIYRFEAVRNATLVPAPGRSIIKIPDATPGIIAANAQSDEQALLAKVRYNRLVDIFLGITCYSLQNHLRTTVRDMGQIETDEIYLGLSQNGCQFVVPVQAKGGSDLHSAVQIRQDIALCSEKFPQFDCRPVGAQFMTNGVIALLEFKFEEGEIVVSKERHYRLVSPDQISEEELRQYKSYSKE